MRFARVMVGILIAAVSVCAGAAGDKNIDGFALRLTASQNAVQLGAPIWKAGASISVLVMTINNSKRTVHYSLTNPGFDWEMDIRDGSGNPVPETEEFRRMKQNGRLMEGRNILVTLKPHETGQDAIPVSYLYNLQNPGKYSIQVRREFPEVGKGLVESNRLDITVEQ